MGHWVPTELWTIQSRDNWSRIEKGVRTFWKICFLIRMRLICMSDWFEGVKAWLCMPFSKIFRTVIRSDENIEPNKTTYLTGSISSTVEETTNIDDGNIQPRSYDVQNNGTCWPKLNWSMFLFYIFSFALWFDPTIVSCK